MNKWTFRSGSIVLCRLQTCCFGSLRIGTYYSFININDNRKSNSKRNQTRTTARKKKKRQKKISCVRGTVTHTKQHGAAAAVGGIAPFTKSTITCHHSPSTTRIHYHCFRSLAIKVVCDCIIIIIIIIIGIWQSGAFQSSVANRSAWFGADNDHDPLWAKILIVLWRRNDTNCRGFIPRTKCQYSIC